MRYVMKLPLDHDIAEFDHLMHYQLIAIVIQITLSKIVDKMKKDI